MKKNKKFSILLSTIFSLVLIVGINSSVAQTGNVVEVIASSEDHTLFAQMLEETELDNIIGDEAGVYTVVAPTDAAFQALGDELNEIQTNPDRMQNVVLGHLFQDEVSSEDVEASLGIEVSEGDIPATNGLVHSIDQVILN